MGLTVGLMSTGLAVVGFGLEGAVGAVPVTESGLVKLKHFITCILM